MGRPLVETPPAVRAAAVEDYRKRLPLKIIAAKYEFTEATISIWAKLASVERRKRGIQLTDTPKDRDRLIIRRAREIPINQVAKEFGMTRARVWSIRTNWKKRGWVEPMPWKAGDTIEWAGEKLKVLRVDDEKRGAVKTAAGSVIDPFIWKFRGKTARLIQAVNGQRKKSPGHRAPATGVANPALCLASASNLRSLRTGDLVHRREEADAA